MYTPFLLMPETYVYIFFSVGASGQIGVRVLKPAEEEIVYVVVTVMAQQEGKFNSKIKQSTNH